MSTSISPVAPVQTRDIRSASVAYKRDKQHSAKWAHGIRPRAGQAFLYLDDDTSYGDLIQQRKARPAQSDRSNGDHKHADRNKIYRSLEQSDSLSKSLLALLPQHRNNAAPAIITTCSSERSPDVLYSFDSRGPTPGTKANRVALDGLIEQAEQKWIAEQTEKIIRGEYEVLDAQGEKTNLKKGKKSPKQKAKKAASVVDEDEGFELV